PEHRHRAVDRRDGCGPPAGDGRRTRPRPHRDRCRTVSIISNLRANLRTDPKRELWFTWYSTVAFYSLYSVVFSVIPRTKPPGKPWLDPEPAVEWFADRHGGLLFGFGLIFVLGGWSATAIALIAYSIRRMSGGRAFAPSFF